MDLYGQDDELDLLSRLVRLLDERTMLDIVADRRHVWRRSEPLISLCVPTHEGRKEALLALLQGALQQAEALPGLVEICVSDNASNDGTADAVAEIAGQADCPIRYRRHSHDRGLAHNLLAAVELASGRYCWLFGSDDLLADRALERASTLLAEFPGATGYTVGAIHADAADPDLRSRALVRAFHPPGERSRLIEGLDRIYDECGNSWCVLSWTIVEREAWLTAARAKEALIQDHPAFPQVIVLAAVAAGRPTWGWLAEPLVRQRNATTFLFERGDSSLAERWNLLIAGAASAWAAVLGGRGSKRWRRRMRTLQKVWGGAADVRGTKLYERPDLRSQVRMALVYLAAFWPARAYWRDVMRLTLLPGRIVRARYGGDSISPARKAALELSGDLPERVRAGAVETVNVRVRNVGRGRVLTDGSRSCTIAQRWSTDGRELTPAELGLNELAELPQSLPRRIRRGRAVDVEAALYAPRHAGRYRVEIAGYQHGRGWLGADLDSQPLAAIVEVFEQPRRLPAVMRARRIHGVLAAGIEHLHVFEPRPRDVETLQNDLGRDQRVMLHSFAVNDRDGPSLGSLVATGGLPKHLGIMKIVAEGDELAIVRGMGALESEAVIVEHSTGLPESVGAHPWTANDMLAELEPRGFSHFAFLVSRGELVTLKWDDAEAGPGAVGSLVFLHDRVYERLLPEITAFASELSERVVAIAEQHTRVAAERLAAVHELKNGAPGRLARVNELEQAADERRRALEETSARATALEHTADERLKMLEQTMARARGLEEAAAERLQALDEATARARELEQAANDGRLQALEETSLRATELEQAAAESRQALEETSRRAAELERAASERLQALEETSVRASELEQAAAESRQALEEASRRAAELEQAANERLAALEETSVRASELEQAANERLAALEETSVRASELEQAANERLAALEETSVRASELEQAANERRG